MSTSAGIERVARLPHALVPATVLAALVSWPATGQMFEPHPGEIWVDDPAAAFAIHAPAVALTPLDDVIVTWEEYGATGDSDGYGIFARRFDRQGASIDVAQFVVNSTTSSHQRYPAVAARTDGDFLVTWRDESSGDYQIRSQLFDSDGAPVGDEQLLNTLPAHYTVSGLDVAAAPSGEFVVVWHGESGDDDTDTPSAQGHRIGTNGVPIGGQFQVNDLTTHWQRDPSVAFDADGTFWVVWASEASAGSDSSGFSIQGRHFAADTTPLDASFQVNTYTTGSQLNPRVTIDGDGTMVVAYVNTDHSLRARRIDTEDPAGSPDDFAVSTLSTLNTDNRHDVAPARDGRFFFAWGSSESTETDDGYAAQGRLNTSGSSFDGDQFQVNLYETGVQQAVGAASGFDRAAVVWRSDKNSSTESPTIQMLLYDLCIFCDDFELASTVRWSSEQP